MVFWYKTQNKKYVAIILDKVMENYYLVLISEEYGGSLNMKEIINLHVYTVAWFSKFDMIKESRLHLITTINLKEDFNEYAGGSFSANRVFITNCGQLGTWKHKFRQLIPNKTIGNMLSASSYNSTIV